MAKSIFLNIFVQDCSSLMGYSKKNTQPHNAGHIFFTHFFQVICVPLPRTHISLVIYVPLPTKHISLVICVPYWETHIPSEMCFQSWEIHIPSDMCSPTKETHIFSDSVPLPTKHKSLVICVFPTWETHILSRTIFIAMLHLYGTHGDNKIWAKIISACAKKCSRDEGFRR